MATRAEVAEKLRNAISEGNIREAYREFEELPIVDQLAISISPVVGDALAVYEVGEFGKRGAERAAERDFLGALGNYGLSALAGLSLIPLFRLFRTARAAKNIDVVKATEEAEPLRLEAPKAEEPELPVVKEVKEFVPLTKTDLEYPGTRIDGNPGLTSKAAKFINTNDKLPVSGKIQTYINKLKTSVPEGELRLLNLVDETGEIHPKLQSDLDIEGPQDKITRQRLAEYIRSNQAGAIERKPLPDRAKIGESSVLKSSNDRAVLSNVRESTFHVRGVDRKRFDHYEGLPEHKDHFVFDSIADFNPRELDLLDGDAGRITEFIGGDDVLNISRIQSDFAEEVGMQVKDNVARLVDYIKNSKPYEEIAEIVDPEVGEFGVRAAYALDFIRANPNLKTGPELMKQFKKDINLLKSIDKVAYTDGFRFFDGAKVIDPKTVPPWIKNLLNVNQNDLPGKIEELNTGAEQILSSLRGNTKNFKDSLEKLQIITDEARKRYKISPYQDPELISQARKGLEEFNKRVPQVNALAMEKAGLRNSLKESGLTPDSPSYKATQKEMDEIDRKIMDLTERPGAISLDAIDEFSVSKADLEKATGKPFTETLDKSLDEIFYAYDETASGSIKQRYGPGTPLERAARYFDEIATTDDPYFNIGEGISILKRATKYKDEFIPGYALDPYVTGKAGNLRTNYSKLPVRSNFLKAVQDGKDGLYLDSGSKRLKKEGGEGTVIESIYQEAGSEIDKILRELGVDPKKYTLKNFNNPNKKLKAFTEVDFEGTYVKIDDELRELVKEKGIDAFQAGGPAISKREQERMARAKKEEIKDAFQDVVGKNFYKQYIEDTRLEDLYNTYKGVSDIPENIEQGLTKSDGFFSPFENELKQILKADDPKAEILKMVDIYSAAEIDRLLQSMDLPVDIRKTPEGTRFGKDLYRGDKINLDFTGYKPEEGDFVGNIKFGYADRTPFGDVSIQSMIDELGDVKTYADYQYEEGPLQIRGQKRPGRDFYGDISYTLDDIDLGNNQKLAAQAIVNNLKDAALRIQYLYRNPQSGAYLGGGLDLSNQMGPELQLQFGKRF